MLIWFIILPALAVSIIMLIWIAVMIIGRGYHFVTVGETEIVFKVKGGECHEVILGFPGDDTEVVRASLARRDIPWVDRSISTVADITGYYFISFLAPFFVKVHKFFIIAEGIKNGTGDKKQPSETAPLREWIYHDKREVSSLLSRFPRPVLVEGVEMMDKFTVDNIVMLMLKVIDPYLLVFTYQGDFFKLVNAITESALIDMVVSNSAGGRKYTYDQYVAEDKGDGSAFALELLEKINHGLEAIGLQAEKAYVYKFALSPGQETVEKAVREKEVKRLTGEGDKAKADADLYVAQQGALGEAAKITAKGNAKATVEAEMAKKLLDAHIQAGASPNTASVLVGNKMTAENLPNLTVLGGKALISIPTPPKKDDGNGGTQ